MRKQWRKRGTTTGRRLALGCVAAALLAAAPAAAVSLSLAPAIATPAPGGSFTAELFVSGLGDGGAPSLAAFDITLSFDADAIAFTSVAFDDFLGSIPAEASVDAVLGDGTLDLAGFSILPAAALDALQPASFRVATIVFSATGSTPSSIAISSALLGDADGRPLTLTTPPTGMNVQPIPEPASALVFGLCLALVARVGRSPSES
jgi:hypothetical protein